MSTYTILSPLLTMLFLQPVAAAFPAPLTTAMAVSAALQLSLLVRTAGAGSAENDFSAYPEQALPCLWRAADGSGCSGDSGAELNDCLCYNGGDFVLETARCVAAEAPGILAAVYKQMLANCHGTGDELSISEEEFLEAGRTATGGGSSGGSSSTGVSTGTGTSLLGSTTATTSPSTSASATTTAARTPTTLKTADSLSTAPATASSSAAMPLPTEAPGTGSLSTGAKAGIGVGAGVGAIAAVFAAWFLWRCARRRRDQRQGHVGSDVSEEGSLPSEPKYPPPPPPSRPRRSRPEPLASLPHPHHNLQAVAGAPTEDAVKSPVSAKIADRDRDVAAPTPTARNFDRQQPGSNPDRSPSPMSPVTSDRSDPHSELVSPVTVISAGGGGGGDARTELSSSSYDSDSVWNFSNMTIDTWERTASVQSSTVTGVTGAASRLGPESSLSVAPPRDTRSRVGAPSNLSSIDGSRLGRSRVGAPSTLSDVDGGLGSRSVAGVYAPGAEPARRSRAQIRQIQRSVRRSGGRVG